MGEEEGEREGERAARGQRFGGRRSWRSWIRSKEVVFSLWQTFAERFSSVQTSRSSRSRRTPRRRLGRTLSFTIRLLFPPRPSSSTRLLPLTILPTPSTDKTSLFLLQLQLQNKLLPLPTHRSHNPVLPLPPPKNPHRPCSRHRHSTRIGTSRRPRRRDVETSGS